jgi:SagB-type dehydrogenase family enzyme
MHDRTASAFAGLLVVAVLSAGCVSEAPAEVLQRSERFGPAIDLPAPDLTGSMTLEQTLADRRSQREFADAELPLTTIGQLFWAGQGITDDDRYRTTPSAGARYPLELYALTTNSLLHYRPDGHRVERADSDALARLPAATFGQQFVASAPLVLIVVGVVTRTEIEYGALAGRLVDREAGHATQNVLLQATALGLVATPVGGFDPDDVGRLLALPPGHEVLYLVPIGAPPGQAPRRRSRSGRIPMVSTPATDNACRPASPP